MRILGTVASSSREIPSAPTIGTATDVGTSRAYNNGAAVVTFTAPSFDGGLPITSYTVTSSPGGFTASGASSPLTVTGLASSTSYTFTVTATNSAGTSPASSASNSITATTVPQAPTIGTATSGSSSATVAYTAGATGGKTVSAYTATSSPGSFTGTGASPITVSGLTNGTSYTFTVTATNANGTSTASAASNAIVPAIPYFMAIVGDGTLENHPRCVAVNATAGLIAFGSGPFASGASSRAYLVVTDLAGVVQWQKTFQSPFASGQRYIRGIGIDNSGNVYTNGSTYTSSNGLGVSVSKFNSSGTLQWNKEYGTIYQDYVGGLAVTSGGTVYGTTTDGSGTNGRLNVFKLDTNGNLVWKWQYGFQLVAISADIKMQLDPSDNPIVSLPRGSYRGAVMKLNSSGIRQWAKYGSGSGDSTWAGTDSSSNVYTFMYTSGVGASGLQKRDSSGNSIWEKQIGGVAAGAIGYGMATDSSGNCYLGINFTNYTYLLKVDTNGAYVWKRRFTSATAQYYDQSVALDSSGNVYLTASIGSTSTTTRNLLFRLPADGSKTGTYSLGGYSITYEATTDFNISDNSGLNADESWNESSTPAALTAGVDTIATASYAASVTNM